MDIKVTILGVKKLKFDSKEGKEVKGTKVFYSPEDYKDENTVGHNVLSEWFEGFEMFEKLAQQELSGKFKLQHTIQMNGSKPQVKVEDFQPVK